jgi:Flp pilus assembly pilin Flp
MLAIKEFKPLLSPVSVRNQYTQKRQQQINQGTVMKSTNLLKKSRMGIAMTEYLIILGIVAIAAIAVIGLFGKQIKSVFTRSNEAMVGSTAGADSTTATASSTATKADNMGTFDKPASQGDK